MKYTYIITIFLLISSCSIVKNQKELLTDSEITNKIFNKKLDLSNMALERIPDLSNHEIDEVDLSNNKIKKFEEDFFNFKIKKINLMNNKIEGIVVIDSLKLENLNISKNKIEKIYVNNSIIRNLNASDNKLVLLQMPLYNSKNINFTGDTLNISNNRKFDNFVSFIPSVYKVILRKNIKNNKPLNFVLERPLK